MPDDIITDAFKSMFPELKRHLDMTTLRHWSKKIANAKNILNKSGGKYYSQNDEDGIEPPTQAFSGLCSLDSCYWAQVKSSFLIQQNS